MTSFSWIGEARSPAPHARHFPPSPPVLEAYLWLRARREIRPTFIWRENGLWACLQFQKAVAPSEILYSCFTFQDCPILILQAIGELFRPIAFIRHPRNIPRIYIQPRLPNAMHLRRTSPASSLTLRPTTTSCSHVSSGRPRPFHLPYLPSDTVASTYM